MSKWFDGSIMSTPLLGADFVCVASGVSNAVEGLTNHELKRKKIYVDPALWRQIGESGCRWRGA